MSIKGRDRYLAEIISYIDEQVTSKIVRSVSATESVAIIARFLLSQIY